MIWIATITKDLNATPKGKYFNIVKTQRDKRFGYINLLYTNKDLGFFCIDENGEELIKFFRDRPDYMSTIGGLRNFILDFFINTLPTIRKTAYLDYDYLTFVEYDDKLKEDFIWELSFCMKSKPDIISLQECTINDIKNKVEFEPKYPKTRLNPFGYCIRHRFLDIHKPRFSDTNHFEYVKFVHDIAIKYPDIMYKETNYFHNDTDFMTRENASDRFEILVDCLNSCNRLFAVNYLKTMINWFCTNV